MVSTSPAPVVTYTTDPHSFAEPGKAVVKHLELNIETNHKKKEILTTTINYYTDHDHKDHLYMRFLILTGLPRLDKR